jgi:[pyruvate, water dikinase]-phosphate phosphotransferase / [pyruvate, water dikinase] kinase
MTTDSKTPPPPIPHTNAVRSVYYVSDRTARTAELNAESLLSQFPNFRYETHRFAFMDNEDKMRKLVRTIKQQIEKGEEPPVIFSTLVQTNLRQILATGGAPIIDLYETFLSPLKEILHSPTALRVGVTHEDFELREASDYQRRSKALDFTLAHDDGLRPTHYDEADVIIVGVSRSAKTPVCLYLAMNFFVRAANFPLTGEDLDGEQLPSFLRDKKDKIVGLHIDPQRLATIRQKRRPDSPYASLQTCRQEVRRADEIFKISGVPIYDSSTTSVEEIAVDIVKQMDLLH